MLPCGCKSGRYSTPCQSVPILPVKRFFPVHYTFSYRTCMDFPQVARYRVVERVVEGRNYLNGPYAVNQFLHLFPFLRRHQRLMAPLNHFPTGHGDNVIGVGADALLVRPKDQMCAFIEGIPQDMARFSPRPRNNSWRQTPCWY